MKRVLSGIQPSGQLHLGNFSGAIQQFVELQADHEMFIFIASYHALTSVRDPEVLRQNITQVATDYIAFGLDPDLPHVNLYRQQDVPEVTELAWLLACVCPKHMMDKATSFKDKTAKGLSASIGLYTYPVLQAADILSVDPDLVPVGKDQVQHCEITRDLAQKFNHNFASEDNPVFRLPDYRVREAAALLPGIDGQKMSKSYDNTIDPFMDEKPLRKRIMKIVSDATPLEDPKDPDNDTTFQIFRAIAGEHDPRTADLATRYRAGGLGYGHAKQELFELVLDTFGPARQRRAELMNDPGYINKVLADGADKARAKARSVLDKARHAVGL
ncbi:tryptophan--tRNA ligase [Mucisphaera calidilacus]|uniref:Tryptophan--tRNA ligase n=1 Tax=Mucisphaera calidilacus TaxID=2527982 RepID=A0A518BY89_9BACT|nr:tryptophan--tRNA ligase [Mucisphaera calidilacus]QDU71945.1 Tryptophan--tRNA ligase [Mucisphaera calidilacus]